jgi:acyl-coenzyme A synthetase/AMP-(fatty) acid ligase
MQGDENKMTSECGICSHNMRSYQETYGEYKLESPEYFNFGFDVIDTYAEDPSLQMMLWAGDDGMERRLSYAYFRDRSNQAVNALNGLGIKQNDHVMIVMSRVPEWWESMIGMIKAGIIAVPGTTQLTEKDIRYRLEASHIRCVISDLDNAHKFDEARKHFPELDSLIIVDGNREGWRNYESLVSTADKLIRPENTVKTHKDDPMLLYFTSGTTGHPKMALHTQSYPVGHSVTGKFWLDLRPGDLHWNLSDTGWAKAAWSSLFGPLGTGATLYVHNTKGKYSADLTLSLLSKYKVTSFCAPPTAYRLLIREDFTRYDLSSLRSCVGAGEPLNPEVIDIWRNQTGIQIRDGYGQTETVLIVGNFPVDDAPVKPGSMGKPSPGFIVDVIDENGTPLPPNKEGDIAVKIKPHRPLGLYREYWGNLKATQATYRGEWYITGDRAYRDEDGYFWFVGRADDVIISSGYRIGPFEVESALIEHPSVLESAVVAKPDPVRGEIVKAFVVLRPGFEPSDKLVKEIQDFVKTLTAPYKYPREIEFATELPKTVSGKIRRIDLRQRPK